MGTTKVTGLALGETLVAMDVSPKHTVIARLNEGPDAYQNPVANLPSSRIEGDRALAPARRPGRGERANRRVFTRDRVTTRLTSRRRARLETWSLVGSVARR